MLRSRLQRLRLTADCDMLAGICADEVKRERGKGRNETEWESASTALMGLNGHALHRHMPPKTDMIT